MNKRFGLTVAALAVLCGVLALGMGGCSGAQSGPTPGDGSTSGIPSDTGSTGNDSARRSVTFTLSLASEGDAEALARGLVQRAGVEYPYDDAEMDSISILKEGVRLGNDCVGDDGSHRTFNVFLVNETGDAMNDTQVEIVSCDGATADETLYDYGDLADGEGGPGPAWDEVDGKEQVWSFSYTGALNLTATVEVSWYTLGVLDTVTMTIGAAGGTIASSVVPDAPSVEFPSGALGVGTPVTLRVLSESPVPPANPDAHVVGHPVEIEIGGEVPDAGLGVTVHSGYQPPAEEYPLAGYLQDSLWIANPAETGADGISAQLTLPAPAATASARQSSSDYTVTYTIGTVTLPFVTPTQPPALETFSLSSSGAWTPTSGQWTGDRVILMVHGLWSGPDDLNALANYLKGNIHCSLYAVEYPSNHSIDLLGKALADLIANRRLSGQLDIVAHSMGGLVSRSAIEEHGALRAVTSLVTLDSPHDGVEPGLIATVVLNLIPGLLPGAQALCPQLVDLWTGSDFLRDLNRHSGTRCDYFSAIGNDATKTAPYWTLDCLTEFVVNLALGPRGTHDGLVQTFSSGRDLTTEASWESATFPLSHEYIRLDAAVFQKVRWWLTPARSVAWVSGLGSVLVGNVDGSGIPVNVANGPAGGAMLSADGRKVAWMEGSRPLPWVIYVGNADGSGAPVNVVSDGYIAGLSGDGTKVAWMEGSRHLTCPHVEYHSEC